MNEPNQTCRVHSGFEARLTNVEEQNKVQWQEINGMKKFIMGTLAVAVLNLLGIILVLLFNLARATGKGP